MAWRLSCPIGHGPVSRTAPTRRSSPVRRPASDAVRRALGEERRQRSRPVRGRARRRFLTGLPLALAAAGTAAWSTGWHTLNAPLLGVATGAAVLTAYTAAFVRTPAYVTAWRAGADGEQATARRL